MKFVVRLTGIIIVVSLVFHSFVITSVCATQQLMLGDADGDGVLAALGRAAAAGSSLAHCRTVARGAAVARGAVMFGICLLPA